MAKEVLKIKQKGRIWICTPDGIQSRTMEEYEIERIDGKPFKWKKFRDLCYPCRKCKSSQ
jgi:hypothetical protein